MLPVSKLGSELDSLQSHYSDLIKSSISKSIIVSPQNTFLSSALLPNLFLLNVNRTKTENQSKPYKSFNFSTSENFWREEDEKEAIDYMTQMTHLNESESEFEKEFFYWGKEPGTTRYLLNEWKFVSNLFLSISPFLGSTLFQRFSQPHNQSEYKK